MGKSYFAVSFESLQYTPIMNLKMERLKYQFGDLNVVKPCGGFKWVTSVARVFEAVPHRGPDWRKEREAK